SLFDAIQIVRMHARVQRTFQPELSGPVQFFELVAEKISQLLTAIHGLAVRRGAIDHRRQRFHKLPEEALSFAQCCLSLHLLIYVMAKADPLDDAPLLITPWLSAARHPSIGAIHPAQAVLQSEGFAARETLLNALGEPARVVGVDRIDDNLESAAFERIGDINPKEIDHAFVEEDRLPARAQPPYMTWDHID